MQKITVRAIGGFAYKILTNFLIRGTMTQVGQINQAIQNAYEELENMPREKPVSTGLLTRTEKKEDLKTKINDAVRLLKINERKKQMEK